MKALLVTDTIASGSSLKALTKGLKQQGITYDIATICLVFKNDRPELLESLGGDIFYAQEDKVPPIYAAKSLSGVKKDDRDLFAKRNAMQRKSQQTLNEAREDGKKIADELVAWYRESGKKEVET